MLPQCLRVEFFGIISSPAVHHSHSHDDLSAMATGDSSASSSSSIASPGSYYSDATLILIKRYTEVADKAFKEEAKDSGGSGGLGAASKKGQVASAPQRKYLGFPVFYKLIQDPEMTGSIRLFV